MESAILYGRLAEDGEIAVFGNAEGLTTLSGALRSAAEGTRRTLALGRPTRPDLYDLDLEQVECLPGSGAVRIALIRPTLRVQGGRKALLAVAHNIDLLTARAITKETEARFHHHIAPEITEQFVAPDSLEVVVQRLAPEL